MGAQVEVIAMTVPVFVDDVIQLYDIYVGGVWIGSRRTEEQCRAAVRGLLG